MTPFDGRAFVAALEPPSFVAGGRRYVGRVLSVSEWLAVYAHQDALLAPPANARAARESRRQMRRLVASWFPAAPWRSRLGAWANPACRAFARLPERVQAAIVRAVLSPSLASQDEQEDAENGTRREGATPLGYLVARFCATYPGLYHAPSLWPTRDGVVPVRVFMLFSAATAHFGAEAELRGAHAAALGQALTMGGAKDMKLRRHMRELTRTAFPIADTP